MNYVIEAGAGPGRGDIVTHDTQSAATSFATSAPAGTYYVRVRANPDEGGIGAASNVTGEWTAQLNQASGRGEFIASLLGVRSDLWVLQTTADPANPASRGPHTHHVGLLNAELTAITNGVRLTGNAIITSNGSVAPYSGSLVQVDLAGGSLLGFSNIKLTFLGAQAFTSQQPPDVPRWRGW